MMVTPLSGKTVLVSRPAISATPLMDMLKNAGADPVAVPCMGIQAIDNRSTSLPAECLLVFISGNAVRAGLRSVGGVEALLRAKRQGCIFAAIGSATAETMRQAGVPVDIVPTQGASAQALLDLPVMQSPPSHCIVVRGEGGSEVLADGLRQRGCKVQYLEVYRRVAVPYSGKEELGALLRRADVLLAASNESLKMVVQQFGRVHRPLWQELQLVVAASHMIKTATDLGFRHPAIVANDATDASMFAAVMRYAMSAVAVKKPGS